MCLGQFSPNRSTISMDPPTVRDTDSRLRFTTTLEAMAAQPSWSLRKVFKSQAPVRPGVARKLGGTAKINLNKYWHVLEDLVHVETSFPTQPRLNSARDYEDIGMSNEINENLANERYEILAASTSRPVETMDVDKPSPSPAPQAQALPVQMSQVPARPVQPPQAPALPEQTSQAPALPVQTSQAQALPAQPHQVQAHQVSPTPAKPGWRERVGKRVFTPKTMTPKPARSPLAIINGNQRRSVTPAKPLPSARKSPGTPGTPKSPMTALAESFQRRLYNRI